MDRRTVLAVFLSITVYYGWMVFYGPELPVDELSVLEEGLIDPSTEKVALAEEPAPEPDPIPDAPLEERAFQPCTATAVLSSHGGGFEGLTLTDHLQPLTVQPIYSWMWAKVTGEAEGPWKPYGDEPGPVQLQSEGGSAFYVGSGDVDGKPVAMTFVSNTPERARLKGQVAPGVTVERSYQVESVEPCLIQIDTVWRNEGSRAHQEERFVAIKDVMDPASGGMMARYTSLRRPLAHAGDGLVIPELDESEPVQQVEGDPVWMGVADRYFGVLAMIQSSSSGDIQFHGDLETSETSVVYRKTGILEPGQTESVSMRAYIGPLQLETISIVESSFGDVVDLGWFAIFAYPLLWLLKACYSLLGSWGLAIIGLTMVVKGLFYPLTNTAFRSSQAMQTLQPKIKELRETYKDDNERMNREMMALFKENKVNPLGGCLPTLIQFPVWIALYNVLLSIVELYQTEFLYLKDLSVVDPYCVLPVTVVAMMMIQQRFTPTGNMDPTQARMMKLMPLMFGFFFFLFPSGLVVYIFVNMALSILQMWWIRRQFEEPATETATA